MKHKQVVIGLGLIVGMFAVVTQAATLNVGDVLTIQSGVQLYNSSGAASNVSSGSFFVLDLNDNNSVDNDEKVAISGLSGIKVGYASAPFEVDTWSFSNIAGSHYTPVIPITGDTETGLNFSGWRVFWNSAEVQTFQNLAWTPTNCDTVTGCTGMVFQSEVANFQWSGIYGDTYQLWYTERLGVMNTGTYLVYLTGTVEAVPVPASVWLFISGMAGLFGITKRKIRQ